MQIPPQRKGLTWRRRHGRWQTTWAFGHKGWPHVFLKSLGTPVVSAFPEGRWEGEANQRNSFSGSSLLTDWLVTLCSACKCMINKTTQCQLWGQCSGRDVDTRCAGSRGREAGTQRRAASERNVCWGADLTGECLGCSWWVFLGCTHPDNDSNCNTSLSRYCKISRKFVE